MARRPFILVAGQSNATPVADAQRWEEEHLTIALRSPLNTVASAPQFSRASGITSDKLTLPITFPGGPSRGQFGHYFDLAGTWQIADCQGKAIQSLKLLTFYNPTASYLNLGTATTQTFPGIGEIGFFSTSRIINGTVLWHYSPDDKTITRLRNGKVHTINHSLGYTLDEPTDTITIAVAQPAPKDQHRFITGDMIHFNGTTAGGGLVTNFPYFAIKLNDTQFKVALTEADAKAAIAIDLAGGIPPVACTVHLGPPYASSTFSVYPPFEPPPEVGEQFTYPIWDGGGSTELLLNVGPAIGGIHDLGSLQDAPPYAASAGAHYAKLRPVYTGVGITGPSRVSMKSRPVTPGQAIQFGSGGVELGGSINGWDLGTNRFTALHWTAVPGVYHTRMNDGTPIQLVNVGNPLPSPLIYGPTYYIRNSTYTGGVDSFQLSDSIDGPILDISTTAYAGPVGTSPVLSAVYYVTRIVDAEDTVAGGLFVPSPTNTITFGPAHGLTHGERIRLSATTFPAPGADGVLNSTTDYYVIWVSPTAIALCVEEPRLLKFNSTADVDPPTDTITIVGHGMANSTKLRLSDTLPVGLLPATDYYVINATANTFQLSLFPLMGAVDITATAVGYATIDTGIAFDFGAGGSAVNIVRKEWYAHFYFSAEPGGSEIELSGPSGTAMGCYVLQSFRGSLTGLVLNVTSGQNAGVSVNLSDVFLGGFPLRAVLRLATPLPFVPALGDTYTIAPPPNNGVDVPFDKFALWLPWSPFEGQAYQYGPVFSGVSEVAGDSCFIDTNGGAILSAGDVIRIYSSGRLPTVFEPGRRYYVTDVGLGGASAFLATTYGGSRIQGVVTDNGTVGAHRITIERQRGRTNPFPPGFNYPNHLQVIGAYQPFDGQTILGPPLQVFYTGLGIRISEFLGEPVYVAACAFGGTGIGHREVTGASVSYGALDVTQQTSWNPSDQNSCFARLLATLDAAKIAFERQGDTGECIGIWWVQGEEDATYEDQANRYYENATKLRAAIRQAIKDRDLCSGPVGQLRWIQPLPQTTFGQYYETVRAAITKMVGEDQYSATHELTDLERNNPVTDPYHYSGSGMTEFERRSYEAWLGLRGANSGAVAICNLALSYIGNKARVTSIDPPDGSTEASLCSTFYELSVRAALRMHPWNFAMSKVALAQVNVGNGDNDDSSYEFRYEIPPDNVQVISVVHADAPNDTVVGGVRTTADFKVKRSQTDKAQRLYTNQAEAHLRYVAFEPDPDQWDPLFGLVVSWHLASMLAGAIIKTQEGDQAAQRCLNRMAQYLAEAKKADFHEQQVILDEKSRYSRARR